MLSAAVACFGLVDCRFRLALLFRLAISLLTIIAYCIHSPVIHLLPICYPSPFLSLIYAPYSSITFVTIFIQSSFYRPALNYRGVYISGVPYYSSTPVDIDTAKITQTLSSVSNPNNNQEANTELSTPYKDQPREASRALTSASPSRASPARVFCHKVSLPWSDCTTE